MRETDRVEIKMEGKGENNFISKGDTSGQFNIIPTFPCVPPPA